MVRHSNHDIWSYFFFLIALILMTGCDNYTENKHLLLDRNWKFKTADDLRFAADEYNDSDWGSIQIASPWQNQGIDYVGFAWYRIKVTIPSSLKQNHKSDSLKIFLGEILDAHQVFLNGSILGENGMIVPETHATDSAFLDQPVSKGEKKYVIPADDPRIRWNKENLLAVRVFNRKNNGGLISGIPYIAMVTLETYLEYGKTFYKPDSTGTVDTGLVMTNNFSKPVSGDLSVTATIPETNRTVFKTTLPVQLKPGESATIPVSLPLTTDQTKVLLLFKEHQLKEAARDSLLVPFVLAR